MTSDVIVAAMAKWFALITHQALESDRLSGEEDQPVCAISAGKIERVGLTGCRGPRAALAAWPGAGPRVRGRERRLARTGTRAHAGKERRR